MIVEGAVFLTKYTKVLKLNSSLTETSSSNIIVTRNKNWKVKTPNLFVNTGWNSELCRLSISWILTACFWIRIWKLAQIIIRSYSLTKSKHMKHWTSFSISNTTKIIVISIMMKNCHILFVHEFDDFYFS